MGQVTLRRRATTDLDEIWYHVAQYDPIAADRLVDRIIARCQMLADYPHAGSVRRELALDARMLIIDGYLVLYRTRGVDAEIVRVMHGARRLEGLLDDDPEA